MEKRKSWTQRRKILGSILIMGSGLLFAIKAKIRPAGDGKPETIRLIGKDGRVVEVDRKNLPKMCAGKVSNNRLFSWLNKNEKNNGQAG